ncbi:hypothetical protein WG899_00620 [Paucibacter sp. AS339]|uniref:substrate-binding periplasmic protein n=1 Tax=Paucibacter hankyongi TaxID=3133434 RepID=UPI0030B20777
MNPSDRSFFNTLQPRLLQELCRLQLGQLAALACVAGLLGVAGEAAAQPVAMPACSHPIRLAASDWPPYLVYQSNGQHHGLDYEVLSAMVAEAGCSLQWLEALPRRRRSIMLRDGEVDLIPAASLRAKSNSGARYTRPYRDEVMGVMRISGVSRATALSGPTQTTPPSVPNLPARLSSFSDLFNTRTPLLFINAGPLSADFEAWRPRLQAAGLLEPFESHSKGISMLQRQRAPLILGDVGTLLHLAHLQGLELQQLPFGSSREPVGFMLSPQSVSEQEFQALDQALGRLELRGVLKDIRRRYGVD